MAGHLVDRLQNERRRLFVGRDAEQTLFIQAIEQVELPFFVFHVSGLGGVGKTSLLRNYQALCAEREIPCIGLDARDAEPSPEAFLTALASSLERALLADAASSDDVTLPADVVSPDSLQQHLADQTQRLVICIDTYELFAPLDNWLRDSFLPQLSDNILVVLAGRLPLSPAWKTDGGWQQLVHSISLSNLSSGESHTYLDRRHVPLAEQQAVLDFTHGHPLALSLCADLFAQNSQNASPENLTASTEPGPENSFHFESAENPAIMEVLLEHLVQQAPTATHRMALQACALVRQSTEDLLAQMLEMPDIHPVFEWLRNLSFIESGPAGLFPHDLMREVLVGDVRWRNPDLHAQLQRRARRYYLARLKQTSGLEQQRVLADYIFLHRTNPVIRPFFDWQERGTLLPQPLRQSHIPSLIDMVTRHEGATSAQLAQHWLARQPEGVLVLQDGQGEVAGFFATVNLHQASEEELQYDPGVWAAWNYLEQSAPLRPGEGATLVRFWMSREDYQSVSAVQSLIFVNIVRQYLATPGLAFSFFCCADPKFWTPALEYADSQRLPEADFEIETPNTPQSSLESKSVPKKHYGMFGHDWRVTPPRAWLELLAEREIATSAAPPSAPTSPISVLSEAEFGTAVQQALRHFTRPALLQKNELLQSRLLNEILGAESDTGKRIGALQTLIRSECETLQTTPQTTKYYNALYHTYLHPAKSQEQAAEHLYVSFSTYRRHLKEGMQRVTELLWQRELGT